jgi:hypothetical protein
MIGHIGLGTPDPARASIRRGPSLPSAARRLGLTRPDALLEVQVETAALDVLDADLLTVTVAPGSRLEGVAVFELRLPPPTVVTLIVRDGSTIVPRPGTVLRTGDELLLITTPQAREAAERRLRAIGRRGTRPLVRRTRSSRTSRSRCCLTRAATRVSAVAVPAAFVPAAVLGRLPGAARVL